MNIYIIHDLKIPIMEETKENLERLPACRKRTKKLVLLFKAYFFKLNSQIRFY